MFAAVFPGQGSQRPGMGRELYEDRLEAREAFERVSSATGVDVAALCFESDEHTLRRTENAQLALFSTGVAAWKCLEARLGGRTAAAMAGHSVGEFAALASAGVISIEDGARLVRRRGELMARAGEGRKGAMAAVLGLEKEIIERLCRDASNEREVVVVANDNCPGQVVVSGDVGAVERLSVAAKSAGAKRVIPLNVSGAFHSPLMAGAGAAFAEELQKVTFGTEPGMPSVYSNVTAEPVDLPSAWPLLLETQLRLPVRWNETMRHMASEGIQAIVECGVGDVLCGLAKRAVPGMATFRVTDRASLEEAVQELREFL